MDCPAICGQVARIYWVSPAPQCPADITDKLDDWISKDGLVAMHATTASIRELFFIKARKPDERLSIRIDRSFAVRGM